MTIGGTTHRVPAPVPRARHAEPDRVRGHLPAARGAGRPLPVQAPGRLPVASGTRSPSSTASSAGTPEPRRVLDADRLVRLRADRARGLRRPPRSWPTPSAWPTPPAAPSTTGSTTSRASSSTAPARAARSAWSRPAQALALLRGRDHVTATDVADLAPDVLRHRLVLSYDALADGVRARRPARPRDPRGRCPSRDRRPQWACRGGRSAA